MNPGAKTHRGVEFWTGAAALVLLVFGCFLILRPFISAALWSMILCYSTWPLFLRLERMVGGRRNVAALSATIILAAVIAVPLAIVGATLAGSVSDLYAAARRIMHEGPAAAPDWLAAIPIVGNRLKDYWTYLSESSSARLEETIKLLPAAKDLALSGGQALGAGVVQVILSLVIAFFLYRDGESAANRFNTTINRIAGDRGSHLLELAGATVRAVVYGFLGTALLQGGVAAIGFLIAGVPAAAFLGFITFIASAIPGVPVLVALAAALWLYVQSSTGWAIFMIIWGLVVGSVDSVVKPLLISRSGGTTPLILIIFGVFGGMIAFGLIGVFIGPTLLAVGYSLLDEFVSMPAPAAAKPLIVVTDNIEAAAAAEIPKTGAA